MLCIRRGDRAGLPRFFLGRLRSFACAAPTAGSTLAPLPVIDKPMPPLTFPELIARVESAGRYDAMRFEPLTFARWLAWRSSRATLARIMLANRCSAPTAHVIACTSWGAFQIMGFNLYSENIACGSVGNFLASKTAQLTQFAKFCEQNHCVYTLDDMHDESKRLAFARVYNGPGNPTAYAARILECLA